MNLIHILPVTQSINVKQPYEMYLLQELQKVAQGENGEAILDAIKAKNTYKILDNGCYELGAGGQIEDVFMMAERIGAYEIILPDVMGDMHATIDATTDALDYIYKTGRSHAYNYMAVCQGSDWDEYMACAKMFAGFDTVSVIGIPKKFMREAVCLGDGRTQIIGSVRTAALMRTEFAQALWEEPEFGHGRTQIHMLGVSWSPLELQKVKNIIRSCDTNLIVENLKRGVPPISSWATFGEKYTLEKELDALQLSTLRQIIEEGI